MPFVFKPSQNIKEIVLIEPKVFGDERGWFMETYKESDFVAAGIPQKFVQYSHSHSLPKGILRGLHFQNNPHAQGKLVRCILGEIFDVGVDIRKGSPTYGKWVGETLTAENKKMLWVPPGFAHGFCTLSDVAEVIYGMTAEYNPESEGIILWNDTTIGVEWPVESPILAPKDASAAKFSNTECNFIWDKPLIV